MKKYLLLLATSLTLAVGYGQTSAYHPFPDSNAVWRWSCSGHGFNCCCNCGGICIEQTDYQDSISGDTIIGLYTYKKLWNAHVIKDYFVGPPNCAPWGYPMTVYSSSPYSYGGAIRQDTALKKIYMLFPSSTQDTLFYDFSLNLGDTLPPSAISNSENYYVSSIDSILIETNYRKRFWLCNITNQPPCPTGPNSPAYIEGIGSTFGLTTPLFEPGEYGCGLNCVQVNHITIYPNSSYACSPLDLTVSVNENENNSFGLAVSPNPFFMQTALQIAEPLQNASLAVYNSIGQAVKCLDNLSGQTIIFHRDNLPSGLYFFRLTQDGNTVSTDKFVITDR